MVAFLAKTFFPFKKLNPRISNVMDMAVNAPTFVSFDIFMIN